MLVLTELLISNFILTGNMILPIEGSKDGVKGDQFSVGSLSLDPSIFIKIIQPCSWACQMFLSPESFGFLEACGLWRGAVSHTMVWWKRVEGIQEFKYSLE